MGCGNSDCGCDHEKGDGGCGNPDCDCNNSEEMNEEMDNHSHDHTGHSHDNPFANLDE